ncbi:hypothetical protein E2320_009093 [Naja naja]|nr:hypothetical protein E2320_009093 [Naja naja]
MTAPRTSAFPPSAETWTSYINRFESYCYASTPDCQGCILGRATRSAGQPLCPKAITITRRHTFRQRTQAENESVSEYVAALRSAALHCGFRDQLDDMLLDQLVWVRDPRLQRQLLAKADLTLKQGIEEAQAAELSSVSAAAIQKAINLPGSKPSTAINYEDAAYEDEYLEEEEEVNRLRTPRPFQKKRPPLQQMISVSRKTHLTQQQLKHPLQPPANYPREKEGSNVPGRSHRAECCSCLAKAIGSE